MVDADATGVCDTATMGARGFTPEGLLARLRELSQARRYWVALSGGLDSSLLLHVLCGLQARLGVALRAVHVNHGLYPDAEVWARFCQEQCRARAVPLDLRAIDAHHPTGSSPEDWARRLRYQLFEGLLEEGDVLLTGHQQDDQAETLLLQLLRGAGPRGLAAMPGIRRLGRGWLARPLLAYSRDQLADFAARQGLRWVEDPSNRDPAFDRNFVRRELMPLMKRRWPRLGATLARAAALQAEVAVLVETLAEQDLRAVSSTQGSGLRVSGLLQLEQRRRNEALRAWLRERGLATPSARHIERLSHELLSAAWDAQACVSWPGVEVRRYRDRVYAMRPLPAHDARRVIAWEPPAPLELPGGTLRAEPSQGCGLRLGYAAGAVTVRFRRGGERCRLPGRSHSHSLKHLFQQAGLPPWCRNRVPLVYIGDRLAAVTGLWVCEPFVAGPHEEGFTLTWDDG